MAYNNEQIVGYWQELLGEAECDRLIMQAHDDIELLRGQRQQRERKPRKYSERHQRRLRQQARQEKLRWHDEQVQKVRRGIDRRSILVQVQSPSLRRR